MLVHRRFAVRYLNNIDSAEKTDKGNTYRYSGGRLHIENDVGHDEWDGAMLLRIYENLLPIFSQFIIKLP
jgi:hypothetical protein